ncbi:MAG TPA: FAD-dependent oxidoreductase [Beijerinckiaceae bacterium]|jgi:D-amino-acid dehydrogenase
MDEARKRIGVIGAGMVGVAAASFLLREGHDVFLVEPGNPGEGTSFGNAGCLNGSSVVPMSMPGTVRNVPQWLTDPMGPLTIRWAYLPALVPWLVRFIRAGTPEKVRAQAKALRGLLGPSLETLAPLLRDAGAEDLVKKHGHLFVYRSEERWRKESFAWELRRENGIAWDEFNADELRQLDPNLSRDYVKGVLVRENGHTVNPHRLVNSLAQAFLRDGGRIERTRATGFDLDGARLTGIRTETGMLAADGAVVAAGIWSKKLAAGLGDRMPLESERGYHLMIRDPEVMPRIPTMDADGKFVATPMEHGIRAAGTVELAGLSAPPNWERARVLLRHLKRMFPALAESYPEARLSTWMGHRPSLPDSLPVIGRSMALPDIVYAFGHGHVGMAAAPMTGKVVAELLSGKPPSVDLAPFSPTRFG